MNTRINTSEIETPQFNCKIGKTEILVIGTAHVSGKSVDDVERSFKDFQPDAVCVELCAPRYEAMRDPDRWRKLDLARLIKEKKLGLLASSLILSSFQKKIGKTTGAPPGAEMLKAADLADEARKKLVLADREVRVTLTRAWSRVGFFSKMWLASALMSSLLVKEEIEPEEIERLKQEDVLADLFKQLPRRYDSVKNVIIDERDSYLAEKIRRTAEELEAERPGKANRVLAVVGAGHLAGISRALTENERTDPALLDALPAKKRLKNVFSWLLVSVLAGSVLYFVREKSSDEILQLIYFWILCRSLGSGLGALLARAHPLTVLVTAAMAPISIFIFVSRLWMYSALTELWLHKPRVQDFESIADDTDTVSGLFKSLYANRVLKLFWIVFLVSLGLTVGNMIFWSDFFRQLIR